MASPDQPLIVDTDSSAQQQPLYGSNQTGDNAAAAPSAIIIPAAELTTSALNGAVAAVVIQGSDNNQAQPTNGGGGAPIHRFTKHANPPRSMGGCAQCFFGFAHLPLYISYVVFIIACIVGAHGITFAGILICHCLWATVIACVSLSTWIGKVAGAKRINSPDAVRAEFTNAPSTVTFRALGRGGERKLHYTAETDMSSRVPAVNDSEIGVCFHPSRTLLVGDSATNAAYERELQRYRNASGNALIDEDMHCGVHPGVHTNICFFRQLRPSFVDSRLTVFVCAFLGLFPVLYLKFDKQIAVRELKIRRSIKNIV